MDILTRFQWTTLTMLKHGTLYTSTKLGVPYMPVPSYNSLTFCSFCSLHKVREIDNGFNLVLLRNAKDV